MNKEWENVLAVQKMQDYIEKHSKEEITLYELARSCGYSPGYATKMFRQYIGKTPFEYIRALKLSEAALRIRDEKRPLKCNYRSYLMAFPKRKLILKRGIKATNYFEFEQEQIGVCQNVWGILCSIKDALNEPMGIWLGDKYRKKGTSIYVQGVEVPYNYDGDIPKGFECIELPEQLMVIFQSEPYEDESFMEEILDLQNYITQYDPQQDGYVWDEEGYRFQFEPLGERGYIEGRSVKYKEE